MSSLFSIVGHFVSDSQQPEVLRLIRNISARGDIISGETFQEHIATLEEAGFVFHTIVEQPVDPASSEPGPALAPPAPHTMLTSLASHDFAIRPKTRDPATGDVMVLRTVPLPPAGWLNTLQELGVTVLEKVDHNQYLVRVDDIRTNQLGELSFVTGLRAYTVDDTVDPANVVAPGGEPIPGSAPIAYEVLVHRQRDLSAVRAWLTDNQLREVGVGRRKVRFLARFGDPKLMELAHRRDVAALDLYVPPEISNDHARHIIGVPEASLATFEATGLQSCGQIVAVADTGVDEQHPDLKGRFVKVVARGRANDASDPHGHGTHVAASLAGDGCASGGTFRGVAPGALVVFQSLMDSHGQLSGLPVDLNELLHEAYEAGARIHNNSWGAAATSVYRMSALEVDEFVVAHPDMLVVVAAGNRAHGTEPRHVPRGHVDLFSIDAPATAKNALTVGASRSSRTTPRATWRQWWPLLFPYPPIADEDIGGDPESLAAFSGRGPCQEHERVKPDIVAPGTCIISARSSTAPDTSFWENWNEHYAIMGGTSMAAPLVAGCATLIREWFTRRGHAPSAALLKATLINGTRWLTGKDAIADVLAKPNFHQGFGIVDLGGSLPNGDGDGRSCRIAFVDTWQTCSTIPAIDRFGGSARFVFAVGPRYCLRICLSWTDPPGRGLQHALGLVLIHRESGIRWLGNHLRQKTYATLDSANNVQIIRIDAPDSGEYSIQVTAISDLIWGSQHFALVVTGDLQSDLEQQ